MKTVILCSIMLMVSCSTVTYKYPATSLRPMVTIIDDKTNNSMYVVSNHEDTQLQYQKWVESGRINKDPALSCFNTQESINYIAITDESITALRTYASQGDYEITHRSTASLKNGEFESLSLEERKNQVRVRSETCFRNIEDKPQLITSEIYY